MKLSMLVVVVCWATIALAEEVRTTDGRTILLKEDGTYEIVDSARSASDAILQIDSHLLKQHSGEYGQNSIRFMPVFTNVSDRTVTAVKFRSNFLDPFGETILTTSGSSDERIKPTQKSTTRIFYNFKDNQFIADEGYDKLLSSALNGTGSIRTDITAIVFEDGEVVKFGD